MSREDEAKEKAELAEANENIRKNNTATNSRSNFQEWMQPPATMKPNQQRRGWDHIKKMALINWEHMKESDALFGNLNNEETKWMSKLMQEGRIKEGREFMQEKGLFDSRFRFDEDVLKWGKTSADYMKEAKKAGYQVETPRAAKMALESKQDTDKEVESDRLNKFNKRILDTEVEFKDMFRNIGKTGPELKLFALEKEGATKKMLSDLEKVKHAASAVQLGLVEMTPLQNFDKQIEVLNAAKKTIGDDLFFKGINKASQTLIQAAGIGPQKPVAALEKNSSAAVAAIITSSLQDAFDANPEKQVENAQLQLLEQAKLQNTYGARIEAHLRKIAEKQEEEEEEF